MLQHGGEEVEVPFRCGDEAREDAVVAVEDVLLQPGCPYALRGKLESGGELQATEAWVVEPAAKEEEAVMAMEEIRAAQANWKKSLDAEGGLRGPWTLQHAEQMWREELQEREESLAEGCLGVAMGVTMQANVVRKNWE